MGNVNYLGKEESTQKCVGVLRQRRAFDELDNKHHWTTSFAFEKRIEEVGGRVVGGKRIVFLLIQENFFVKYLPFNICFCSSSPKLQAALSKRQLEEGRCKRGENASAPLRREAARVLKFPASI